MHYSNSTRATFEALNNKKLENFLYKLCQMIIWDDFIKKRYYVPGIYTSCACEGLCACEWDGGNYHRAEPIDVSLNIIFKYYKKNKIFTFKNVNKKKIKKLFSYERRIEKIEKIENILKGKEFLFLKKKYKLDYISNFKSFYFIENDEKLIRISDHWSSLSGISIPAIKECGSIRDCFWSLKFKTGIISYFEFENPSAFESGQERLSLLSGFCMLKNFKPNI